MKADPPIAPRAEDAGRRNMLLLVQLRWIAVAGQLATIGFVEMAMGVRLPVAAMLAPIGGLVLLNLVSQPVLQRRQGVANGELFAALLLDVLCLTIQFYLSGGATNPFISLFLLQIAIGAVLLEAWSAWAIVALTGLCFALLTAYNRPLLLPPRFARDPYALHIAGAWVAFVMIGCLLVALMTRIGRNLRARDKHLADMRQRAAEEDHIVRMGLLASGAAHELGTPLASLAVILGDWRRMPALTANTDLAQEIEEMQAEVRRCKSIVTGILLAAGEARGEAPVPTTVTGFLYELVEEWVATRGRTLAFDNRFGKDVAIVSDPALKQVIWTVLDNAAETSPQWVGLVASRIEDMLAIAISDRGPGFPDEILANLGKPYQSTKGSPGRGLGLFLVMNVMRKLGGHVAARNLAGDGATVTLSLPLAAVVLPEPEEDEADG